VYTLLNQVLEIGRHFKISCLMTNHLPSNRSDTRRILNECHNFTYFPRSSSSKIKYVLLEYLGLDKKQIKDFKKQNSRWISISKNFPGVWLAEHSKLVLRVHTPRGVVCALVGHEPDMRTYGLLYVQQWW
jgi:hypothetical protein